MGEGRQRQCPGGVRGAAPTLWEPGGEGTTPPSPGAAVSAPHAEAGQKCRSRAVRGVRTRSATARGEPGLGCRPCGAQAGVGAPLAEHEAAGCRRAAGGMPALFKQHVNGLWPSRPRVIASGFGDNYFRNSWLFFFCAAVMSVQTDSVKERM